ncbi:hypothetical protein ACS0TY_015379 [Phlomoides rotata]
MLTGKSSPSDFKFRPRSSNSIDDECVIVEGWEGDQVYWVHVWTLKDGVITMFREYFNTWLTVKDLRRPVVDSSVPFFVFQWCSNCWIFNTWTHDYSDSTISHMSYIQTIDIVYEVTMKHIISFAITEDN